MSILITMALHLQHVIEKRSMTLFTWRYSQVDFQTWPAYQLYVQTHLQVLSSSYCKLVSYRRKKEQNEPYQSVCR